MKDPALSLFVEANPRLQAFKTGSAFQEETESEIPRRINQPPSTASTTILLTSIHSMES